MKIIARLITYPDIEVEDVKLCRAYRFWILLTGFWVDGGIWKDESFWKD